MENKPTKEEIIKNRKGYGKNGCLIPASMRSKEEVHKNASMGGQATKELYEKRRNAKEIMQTLLSLEVKPQHRKSLGEYADLLPENATMLELLSLVQMREAQQGSTKAFEVIRDTAGYKPVERQEITADIMTDNDRALLEKVAKRTGATGENTP